MQNKNLIYASVCLLLLFGCGKKNIIAGEWKVFPEYSGAPDGFTFFFNDDSICHFGAHEISKKNRDSLIFMDTAIYSFSDSDLVLKYVKPYHSYSHRYTIKIDKKIMLVHCQDCITNDKWSMEKVRGYSDGDWNNISLVWANRVKN